jgi:hypothetical protein
MDANSINNHLGQPAVAISRRPRLVRAEGADERSTCVLSPKPAPGCWSDPKPYTRFVAEPLGTREDYKRDRAANRISNRGEERSQAAAAAYPPSRSGMKKISQPGRIGWK